MLAEKTDNISWGATMHINPERLKARIDAINAMSKNESGGYTRLAFTEKDRQAREAVMGMMSELMRCICSIRAVPLGLEFLKVHGTIK